MGLVTNGTHSSQMEIPNGNFPGFFVNGKGPWTLIYHGKLASQIARLAAIVVKKLF